MRKIFRYTWESFNTDLIYFKTILEPHNFNKIIGISRGGSCLAVNLSYRMGDIPVFHFDPKRDNLSQLFIDFAKNKILIVDDINDTGNTLKNVRSCVIKTLHPGVMELMEKNFSLDNIKFLTIFNKKNNLFKVDFFMSEITDKDTWVVFPWEE